MGRGYCMHLVGCNVKLTLALDGWMDGWMDGQGTIPRSPQK